MKKWIYSALIYLSIVVGVYFVIDTLTISQNNVSSEESHDTTHHSESADGHSESSHGHGEEVVVESEVHVTVKEEGDYLLITLQDMDGKPVRDLEINHEKILHLIIVDNHLEQYFHLHPEEIEPGKFKVNSPLDEGQYKAFVDILPTGRNYVVEPISFTSGRSSTSDHSHASLQVDEKLEKIVDGNKVTLEITEIAVNEPVTLTFDVHDAVLEPYLGALGHVVILDEKAEEYLHVHPINEEKPVFETQFSRPGIYKIWAEFQQGGKVTAYPFVIEVE